MLISAPEERRHHDSPSWRYNDYLYDFAKDTTCIQTASCTTIALAPLVQILHEHFQVKRGRLDAAIPFLHERPKDLDLTHQISAGQGAAMSMMRRPPGAPSRRRPSELKGSFNGFSPGPDAGRSSVLDLVAETKNATGRDQWAAEEAAGRER